MSENSPQGSFLRTLPYGSRDPAHLPSPRSPREERTWTRCHWTLHLKLLCFVSRLTHAGEPGAWVTSLPSNHSTFE